MGKPDAPSNCTVLDVTTQSATVFCAEEGYPGASPRTFVVEAYLPHDNHLLSNATNTTAFLVVENLPSGTNITLVTYAVNPAGRSLKRGHVHARTMGDATSLLGGKHPPHTRAPPAWSWSSSRAPGAGPAQRLRLQCAGASRPRTLRRQRRAAPPRWAAATLCHRPACTPDALRPPKVIVFTGCLQRSVSGKSVRRLLAGKAIVNLRRPSRHGGDVSGPRGLLMLAEDQVVALHQAAWCWRPCSACSACWRALIRVFCCSHHGGHAH